MKTIKPHSQTISKHAMGRQRGQGMSEYLVIVGLIAVAGIAVAGLFGQAFQDTTAGMAKELTGQDGGDALDSAAEDANTAVDEAGQKNTLGSFDGQSENLDD